MSHQYPSPGQPGEQPPTQVAPQGGQAPGAPQYGTPGGYPQQGGYQQSGYPQQGGPGGYPGGGGGYPGGPGGPGGFQAPPTGGGGSKKGLIIGIVAAVVVLVLAVGAVLFFVLGDDDDDNKTAKDDETSQSASSSPTSESPTTEAPPTTEVPPTTETTTDGGQTPTDSPTIASQAFLDSLLEGDCLAVEGLSTPEYFKREFGDQAGCKANAGNLEMSNAEYTFDDPVITNTTALVTGDVYAPNTGKTLNSIWTLQASGGQWLVDGFTYTEGG
ncbi:hypothetical protein [Nocardioides sp. SYSU DS0651]|uniref:hypothetical protein n=1 Tax=Nocardioides sp. SYSU DS0651 TaxID=3415955 RepID=UPI003F4C07B6